MPSQKLVSRGNVLMVANYESDVGYAWWLMENFWIQISEIAEMGQRKSFLIYPSIGSLPQSIAAANIECVELRFPNSTDDGIDELARFVTKNNISIVYLTDRPYRSSVYSHLRMLGVEMIINHDHSPGRPTLISRLSKFPRSVAAKYSRQYCDRYIAVSKYVFNKLVNLAGIPKQRCHTILNGIQPIGQSKTTRTRMRRELGVSDNSILAITVGRASQYKGIDFLIKCAAAARDCQDLLRVEFIHCGDGPDLDHFRDLIEAHNVGSQFRCLGHRDDIKDILQAADVALHASPDEACSLSILEYMSSGLPTLAPPVGGNLEEIVDGVTGFFYEYRNEEALLSCLKRLVRDDKLRKRLGHLAEQHVQENFSISDVNVRFRQHIESLFDAIR